MSKPAIRVALKEFRLHINYATLSCLENPPYLHFRYNEKKNLLAVSGSNEETANSFEVPKRASHGECYISRMAPNRTRYEQENPCCQEKPSAKWETHQRFLSIWISSQPGRPPPFNSRPGNGSCCAIDI
ncbi:MAG: hypothetical protein FWB96_03880 [Defluviitaleaceae bacterium]|nr:hypothetical protein [Defluviitaleaceae bacterium]MCL2264368.1 hypothetical protein [Defluviitaleaceae bacterium]